MNKISIEEMAELSYKIWEMIALTLNGLAIGEIAEIIGAAVGYTCIGLSERHQEVTRNDVLGVIYQTAAKSLKYELKE